MKKKPIILMLIAIFTIGMLASCSSGSGDEVKYADQDFMKSLAKGLEARWDIKQKQDAEGDQTVQGLKDCIQAELDEVEQYQSATFEDTVLQEKALGYINVLKNSMEVAEYCYATEGYEKWTDVYDQRTMMLKDFADNYGLTVRDKYKDTFDELMANGKAATAKTAQKEAVQKLVDNLEFELIENSYGWKKYEAILDNTSDYDITHLSLDISLLDADGVIVDTGYADVENISKGQKARVEFSTDAEFETMEPIINYFEAE